MEEAIQEAQLDCLDLAADIVSAYVGNNSLPTAELPALITQVYGALKALSSSGRPEAVEAHAKPTPAQIRKSITPDALISFVDDKPYRTLKRHLRTHGLDIEGYRERYGLPVDYPTVSANYAKLRSDFAKALGLGRGVKRSAVGVTTPTPQTAKPKRRKTATVAEAAE